MSSLVPYSGGVTVPGPNTRPLTPPLAPNVNGAGVQGTPLASVGSFMSSPVGIGLGAAGGIFGLSSLLSGGGPDYSAMFKWLQSRMNGGELAKMARDIYTARLAGPAFQGALSSANLAGNIATQKINQNLQTNGLIGDVRGGFAAPMQGGAAAIAPALRSQLYAGLDQSSWDSAMNLLAQQVDAMLKMQPGMSFQQALLSLLGMGASAGGQIIAANSKKKP